MSFHTGQSFAVTFLHVSWASLVQAYHRLAIWYCHDDTIKNSTLYNAELEKCARPIIGRVDFPSPAFYYPTLF